MAFKKMEPIKINPHSSLHKNEEGYTLMDNSLGFSLIAMDVPYTRLQTSPALCVGFLASLDAWEKELPERAESIQEIREDIKGKMKEWGMDDGDIS